MKNTATKIDRRRIRRFNDPIMNETQSAPHNKIYTRLGVILGGVGSAGAAMVSLAILVQTLEPDAHIRGCGGGGCAGAWASKWSSLFGLPVAGVAVVVYAGLLGLICWHPRGEYSRGPVLRSGGLLFLGVSALLSILYFAGIQAFILRELCKWCLAAHVFGMVAVIGVCMTKPWSPEVGEYCFLKPRPLLSTLLAIVVFGCFAGLQSLDSGPQTHKIVGITPPPTQTTTPPQARVTGQPDDQNVPSVAIGEDELLLPDGSVVDRGRFPTVGPIHAQQVVVKLYDYTCDSCRDMHKDLEAVWSDLPGEPALVLVPCPLNRDCHPGLPASIHNHAHACELARIALAVWRAAPEAFHDYHRWAFERKRRPDEARRYAEGLVDPEALGQALADPAIDADIALATRLFASAGGPRMPKLFLPNGQAVIGVTRSTGETQALLERALRQ